MPDSSPSIIELVLHELTELRGEVREARDAALDASAHARALDGELGSLLGVAASARDQSALALRRIAEIDARCSERCAQATTRNASRGQIVVAWIGLLAVVLGAVVASAMALK